MSHQINLTWSAPKRQRTVQGERLVSEAKLPYGTPETEAFWAAWKANKQALRDAGYSPRQTNSGSWVVFHYAPLPKEEQEAINAVAAASREASRATDADVVIPAPTGLEYLPYQKAGIAFAGTREASLIADEMGLGKTIQAIGIVNNDESIKRAVVICPASLRLNWERELVKWLVRPLKVAVIQKGGDAWPGDQADIIVINYDILGRFQAQLRAETWDLLVADEAHYCKDSKALRTREVFGGPAIKKTKTVKDPGGGKMKIRADLPALRQIPARRRVLLTGTPVVNRPKELWSLVHYLAPQHFNNFWSFHKRYTNAHNNGYGWDFSGAANLGELQDKLRSTIMVRRLKAHVLTELPPKRRQIIALPANGASECIANEQAAEARHEEQLVRARAALELAKASSDPAEYERAAQKLKDLVQAAFTEIAKLRHQTAVAKAPYVVEHVLDGSGPTVIMAHHLDVIDIIKKGLEAEYPGEVVSLTGEDNLKDRQAAVDAFQAGKARFFVGGIKAAGVGITLTASSHVVFAELDWTPGGMSQAEDRCHRIGQANSVLVQHIVLDGSIDARIAHTLVAKQNIIDKALDKPTQAQEPKIEESIELDLDTLLEAAAARQEANKTDWQRVRDQKDQEARERREAKIQAINSKRAALEKVAAKLTPEQIKAIHDGLRYLDSLNQDRAQYLNDAGFNRVDTHIGIELSKVPALTPLQAALGHKVLRKYRRQLDEGLYGTIFDTKEERDP